MTLNYLAQNILGLPARATDPPPPPTCVEVATYVAYFDACSSVGGDAVVEGGDGGGAQRTDVGGHELLAPVDGPRAGAFVPRLEAGVAGRVASPRPAPGRRHAPCRARTWSSALVAQIVHTS